MRNPLTVQTILGFPGVRGGAGQLFLPPKEEEILDGKKVLLNSTHTHTMAMLYCHSAGFSHFNLYFSSNLFELFHSCFCSWRAGGNIPFLTAKPALPAHSEPWQPCSFCPHPLPAAPAPPPHRPTQGAAAEGRQPAAFQVPGKLLCLAHSAPSL